MDKQLSIKQRMSLMSGWTTNIVINAPPEKVWQRVTDFAAYSTWNPFILKAKANFQVGGTIEFLEDIQQFGKHWISAEFLTIDPPHSFVWSGYFVNPFLFKVRHSFTLEAIENGRTRFSQKQENFGLLISYLAWRGVYVVTRQGYISFDRALKEYCE